MRLKSGRPLLGDKKRVRLTITLHPDDVAWLKRTSMKQGESISGIIDSTIHSAQKALPEGKKIRIPIPFARIAEVCTSYHVQKLSLFGSVLTKNFSDQSDIDVLVEFKKKQAPGFFRLAALEKELSNILGGRKIDLRTPADLGRHLRTPALLSAEVIYAA